MTRGPIVTESRSDPPPTQRGPVGVGGPRPERRAIWPTVLGVLAVIFGSLGLLNAVFGLFGILVPGIVKGFFEQQAQQQPGVGLESAVAQMEVIEGYFFANLLVLICSFALSIMLLAGGIALLRRRPSARRTMMGWAVLAMIKTIPSSIVGYLQADASMQVMADEMATSAPGAFPAWMFNIWRGSIVVIIALQVLVCWAGPVFVLIWFSLRFVRNEILTWITESPEPAAAPGSTAPVDPAPPTAPPSSQA